MKQNCRRNEQDLSCIITNVFVTVRSVFQLTASTSDHLLMSSLRPSLCFLLPDLSFQVSPISLSVFPSLTHSHFWSEKASAYLLCLWLLWKLSGWSGFGVWLFVHILISPSTLLGCTSTHKQDPPSNYYVKSLFLYALLGARAYLNLKTEATS